MLRNKKIILGTVQLGMKYGVNNKSGKPSRQKAYEILHKAYELGIDTIDTAEAYGDSHSVIADFHKQVPYRFKVITKYSNKVSNLSYDIVKRVEQHCFDLQIENLFGYMFHSHSEFKEKLIEIPSILKDLTACKHVVKVGVSVYSNEEIEDVLNYKEITLIQLPFNLFDNDSKRGEILRKAKENGVEIHTRSTFLQGLFFKDPESLLGNLIELKVPLKELHKYVFENNLEISALSLKYPLKKKYIDQTLIGVDSVEQLEDNIKCTQTEYPDSIYKSIDMIHIKKDNLLNPGLWIQ